ncbi:hypothetical protein [Treponema pedis]|uniref:hypothetical protein n=1 Tax=Treponema pedis TaxID=409322 RepID=UPI0003F638A0|nr:hypothetical protein [Treponema pedis]
MKQTVGKRLKDYTAAAINTEGDVYKDIMATDSPVKENQAAIERALNELFEFLEYYREPDIFKHEGKHQLKSLNFFSGLKKNGQESLIEFVTKYKGLMIRSEPELDTVWGTKWNMEHALRYFFGHDNCFVMEYTNEQDKNLLSDKFTSDKWLLNNNELTEKTANLTEESALVNIKAIRLDDNMRLKTKTPVQIPKGTYSFHFFMRGQSLKPDNSRYGQLEVKIGDVFKKEYSSGGDWTHVQEYLHLEAGDYDFIFSGIKSADVDFVCLYPAVPYPSLSIVIGNGGMLGRNFMFFAPGGKDVEVAASGEIAKYYEPPYKGTHSKYKFWFPNADDTEEDAKIERKKKGLQFDDVHWGYYSDEMRWLDVAYINILLDALIPVGVKPFGIIMSRRGV